MCGHSCSASKSNLETPALSKSYIENLRDMFIIASDTCLCGSMSSSYPAHIWRHPSTQTQSSLLVSFCPLASSITSGSTLWSSQRGSHEGLLDSKLFRDQGFLSLEEEHKQGYPYSRTAKSSPWMHGESATSVPPLPCC